MGLAARIGYWALAVLAVLVALASFRVLTFNPAVIDSELRPNLLQHPVPFYIHTILGPAVLLIGVWQFLPLTRRSAWHRWAGRVYVVGVLISAVTGFSAALTTNSGPWHATGFAILAVLWFGTTLIAFAKVRAGKYAEHRRWMIRSYALTCAAITLRIILPVGIVVGLPFSTAYLIAAWGCWTINLVIAELIIQFSKPPKDLPADGVRPAIVGASGAVPAPGPQ